VSRTSAPAGLGRCPRGGAPECWFLVLAVGLTFDDQFPRCALEPVDGRLSKQWIGQGGQPPLGSRFEVSTVDLERCRSTQSR
jgi:hypothetical protein